MRLNCRTTDSLLTPGLLQGELRSRLGVRSKEPGTFGGCLSSHSAPPPPTKDLSPPPHLALHVAQGCVRVTGEIQMWGHQSHRGAYYDRETSL